MSIFKKKTPTKKVEEKKETVAKAVSVARTISGDAYRILVSPIVTEKYPAQGSLYAFVVAPKANKLQITKAVQEAYGVKVAAVRVMNMPGKSVRSKKGYGRRADWRKAVVSLEKGQTIDLFAKNA